VRGYNRGAMPFKSQAQRRKFAQLLVKGEITPRTFEEWNRETGRKKLPERVKRKTKRARKRTVKRTAGQTAKRIVKRKTTGRRARKHR
jgi:hypothetical protein